MISMNCPELYPAPDPKLTASNLLDALKSNYLTTVHLGTVSIGHPYGTDPWDPVSKQAIEMISRLNSAGRIYLTTDALDLRVSLQVLEKVNGYVNCLFFHLRENPSLILRSGDLPSSPRCKGNRPSRKRSALS
jgi:hypothetical protein